MWSPSGLFFIIQLFGDIPVCSLRPCYLTQFAGNSPFFHPPCFPAAPGRLRGGHRELLDHAQGEMRVSFRFGAGNVTDGEIISGLEVKFDVT